MVFQIRGTLQPIGQPTAPAVAAGTWRDLREGLKTKAWGWTIWSSSDSWVPKGFWRKPFSWDKRQKAVQHAKTHAMTHLSTAQQPVGEDFMRVCGRISECQDKRGKSIKECQDELAQINRDIRALKNARAAYAESGLAKHEKLPRLLTDPAKQALANSQARKEVAEVVQLSVEAASKKPNQTQSRDHILGALVLLAGTHGVNINAAVPGAVAPNSSAKVKADNRRQIAIWNAIDAVRAAINAEEHRVGLLVAAVPGGGNQAAQQAALRIAGALSVANVASTTALDNAKSAEDLLNTQALFLKSGKLLDYAKDIQKLKKRLHDTASETLESLFNIPSKSAYTDEVLFRQQYEEVLKTFDEAAGESMRELDGVQLSLGLPSIRGEKQKTTTGYALRQWRQENLPSTKAVVGLTLGEGVLGGTLFALSQHTAAWAALGYTGLGLAAIAVNVVALATWNWYNNNDSDD